MGVINLLTKSPDPPSSPGTHNSQLMRKPESRPVCIGAPAQRNDNEKVTEADVNAFASIISEESFFEI